MGRDARASEYSRYPSAVPQIEAAATGNDKGSTYLVCSRHLSGEFVASRYASELDRLVTLSLFFKFELAMSLD